MGKHGTNIHKRADGRWEVRVVQGEPVNGKTNYKFLYGDTYQEAADKKREFERTLQSQRYADAVSSVAEPFLCRVAQMMAASTVSAPASPLASPTVSASDAAAFPLASPTVSASDAAPSPLTSPAVSASDVATSPLASPAVSASDAAASPLASPAVSAPDAAPSPLTAPSIPASASVPSPLVSSAMPVPESSVACAPTASPATAVNPAISPSPETFVNSPFPSYSTSTASVIPAAKVSLAASAVPAVSPSFAASARKRVTVREAALAWLSAKQPHVKESTYAYYKTEVECHILPVLGDLYMEDITQQMIADYQKTQKESGRKSDGGPLSNKTVSDLNMILKQIFSYASETGLIERAPVFPGVSFRPKPVCIFTKKEQKRLEEFLKEEDTIFAIGVRLALHCGLRIGEICALRWEDFDFQNETLRVNKTVTRIGQTEETDGTEGHKEGAPAKTRLVITTPKTDYSIRTIPIPEAILPYLKERRGEASVYVISGSEKFMEPRTCRRRFKRLLARAGVADHTFHCLRHTFATRCIEKGVDIKALSEILGHSDVKVTMQRYVHPTMEYKREQLNKLG